MGRLITLVAVVVAAMLLAATSAVGQDDGGDAAYSRKGADTCLACHEDDKTLAVFAGKHGVPSDSRSPFGHGQLQCEACHGPGDSHAGRVRRGQERPPNSVFWFNDDGDNR